MTPERIKELRAIVDRLPWGPHSSMRDGTFCAATRIYLPEMLDAIERVRALRFDPHEAHSADMIQEAILAALEGKSE